MIEVNRKILGIAVVLMTVAMLATPLVSAKPTSAENNPNSVSFVWHSENGGHIGEDVVKTNPPWAEGPEVIVTHTYAVWALNDDFNNYVKIGGGPEIKIYAEDYEGSLYVQTVTTSPTSGALNYRVYDKVMWGEDNYIEIKCNERATFEVIGFDPITGEPIIDFYASGIFSGHGVINGQKVQVTGVREGYFDPMVPAFVLQCSGTIRYAGNA